MKLSRYTILVKDYPEPGKSLAYNTRSQSLIVLNEKIRGCLDQMPSSVNRFDTETQSILKKLEGQGLVVPDDENELEIVKKWFETIRYNSKKLEAYVLTTYFCNFACPYCFEGKVKEQQKYMSKQKAIEVMEWLKHKAMEVNPEKIEIVFYGGEPLMNKPIVEFIAENMHKWASQTPWKFEFSMITNGSLVTPDLVDRLNNWGLKSLRFTIDGDKDMHDQFRPFISGKGTFDIIMRNIKAVADKTKVVLASNFNVNSYDHLYRLMDYLEEAGLKEKLAMVDFKPITERAEPIDPHSQALPSYGCDLGHGEKMLSLKKELIKRGFNTAKALDGGGICHFKSADHEVIIDPDGIIFKCPAMVGQYDKSCGNVSDLKLNSRYQDFISFDMVEWKGKCGDCRFLPFCAGGCNYHAELQTGNYQNVFCEKEFFDKTIDEYIKIKYNQIMDKKKSHEKKLAETNS